MPQVEMMLVNASFSLFVCLFVCLFFALFMSVNCNKEVKNLLSAWKTVPSYSANAIKFGIYQVNQTGPERLAGGGIKTTVGSQYSKLKCKSILDPKIRKLLVRDLYGRVNSTFDSVVDSDLPAFEV